MWSDTFTNTPLGAELDYRTQRVQSGWAPRRRQARKSRATRRDARTPRATVAPATR